MSKSILIAQGMGHYGLPAAFSLAQDRNRVFVGLPRLGGPVHKSMVEFALSRDLDLHAVQLDPFAETSVDAALDLILNAAGSLDVLIHQSEPETSISAGVGGNQNDGVYDLGLRSMPLVARAVVRHMRRQCRGLLTWIANPSPVGSTLPSSLPPGSVIAPGFDVEAVQLAKEGIDYCTIHPRSSQSWRGPAAEADRGYVGKLITEVVSLPIGARPQRILVQSRQDTVGLPSHKATPYHSRSNFEPEWRFVRDIWVGRDSARSVRHRYISATDQRVTGGD
jgi:NAD(P)-dependent dehydrogenase (short-subunit alcohol dehydrogenase family)